MTAGRYEFARYALAVLVFIGIAMFTKQFLTWTWGPMYFVTVLEVLPRSFRAVRSWLRPQAPERNKVFR